jgi:lipid-A-disaccharide synthase-like uncharacterized protein
MAWLFSFILAHQGDAADPELLRWIKVKLDHIFGPGPWVVVGIMGLIIISIPIFIIVMYLMQANRRSVYAPPEAEEVPDQNEQEKVP